MHMKSLMACLLAGMLSVSAAAQNVKWTIGWTNANGSSYVETIKTVPARIEAATKGRLKIELYDTLVAGAEQPAAVRDGRLDGSFAVSPWLSAEAPLVNFGHLPGLLTDVAVYQKMLDPLLREETAKVWATKYKAVQLATGVFEDQCIISKVPLHTVADFAGKKIRVHNTEAAALMSKLGAVPTPVPFGEITPALQRGIVDIVMTSVGTANGFGFPTVAKHLSIWRVGTVVPWSFVVNQGVWDKLPADLKPVVESEFRKIENEHFARHAAFSKDSIDRLAKAGMTVYVAPPEEQAKMFAPGNVNAVFENWYSLNEKAGTDGRALVKKINELKGKV
ncbi:MAG: C4-dicarboxylate transporter substrate-binding protein [Ramlibacter sp.]|jgi:TRAP-type C4-dicarboxylate transport system substrate-binding protein|nr:C4-dicarboxylate transporter substrate-binding protein [Ramlibacter sp.]